MGCTSSHITDMVDSGSGSTLQQGEENLHAQEGIGNKQEPSASLPSSSNDGAAIAAKQIKDPAESPPPIPVNGKKEQEDHAVNGDANLADTPLRSNAEGDQSSVSSYDLSKAIDDEIVERMPVQGVQYGDEADTGLLYEDEYADYRKEEDFGRKSNNTEDSFDDSFYRLPQQEKIKQLNSLLDEFNLVSEDPTDLGNLLPLLFQLFSVVLHERNAFVLRQYFLLMTNHNSVDAFLRILYNNETSCDCVTLCVRLLLFFFINSDNSRESISMLLQCRGVPIIISALQEYAEIDWLLRSIVCELFALVYTLSQSGDLSFRPSPVEHFCVAFVEAGGLGVLFTFLQLISDHQLCAFLDTAQPAEEGVRPLNNEQYTNVKNLLYYVSFILAAFSRFGARAEGA